MPHPVQYVLCNRIQQCPIQALCACQGLPAPCSLQQQQQCILAPMCPSASCLTRNWVRSPRSSCQQGFEDGGDTDVHPKRPGQAERHGCAQCPGRHTYERQIMSECARNYLFRMIAKPKNHQRRAPVHASPSPHTCFSCMITR